MRKIIGYSVALFAILFVATSCFEGGATPRKSNFDQGWKFTKTDTDGAQASGANTERAYEIDFDDSQWRDVDLPHDWSVEPLAQGDGVVGPFTKSSVNGIPTGQTAGGEGWYRKTFTLAKRDMDKRIALYFEGVYMDSELWVNGQQVGNHPYGYTAFRYDITSFCNPAGEPNVVAVRVRNNGKNSRWYAGSGIYRHVWLETYDKLHLDTWGAQVKSSVEQTHAEVEIVCELINESATDENCTVEFMIRDSSGLVVRSQKSLRVAADNKGVVTSKMTIENPALWDTDHPNLYSAEVRLLADGKFKDCIDLEFGIRDIEFSADRGFMLNGKNILIKGGCVHHDNGLLGAVAIDRAEERKVELLKANGYNAIRCAHNPPSEKFLQACDKLGMLVIDEAFDQWVKPKNPDDYHLFFEQWSERDIASMILRDRNHPSIIMWSIGNEIRERADDKGVEIAERLRSAVLRYDNTRPVTAAVNEFWDNPQYKWSESAKAFSTLDVAGYNYMWWEYENDHKLYPQRVIYGSETTAGEAAVNWDLAEKHPYIIGEFVWTALDYLGESGIGHALPVAKGEAQPPQFLGWPWFNAWCGDVDICGDKKPQSYYRDVIWRISPIEIAVHAPMPEGSREKVSYWGWTDELRSWNWAGCEQRLMSVNVYTRHPKAKLYLNGELIGEKQVSQKSKYTANFEVAYRAGRLTTVGITDKGEAADSVTIATTGTPVAIRLTADRAEIRSSRDDLSYVKIELIDSDGNVVPDGDRPLTLSAMGCGEIAAAGNASPTDMKSFRSLTPNTFRGRAIAIVRPDGNRGGDINLVVKSEGLSDASITVKVKQYENKENH